MSGHKGHIVVAIAHTIVSIVAEGGMGIAVGGLPAETVVEQHTAKSEFTADTATASGVDHHTSEAVVARHHRELLVAYLHQEERSINGETVGEEIEMGAYLIVPTGLGMVGDGVVHISIIGGCMGDIHVASR